jgi:hypothetical protein
MFNIQIDPRALEDFQAAMDRIMANISVDLAFDETTPEELALEEEMADAIGGPLEDSYVRPIAEDDGSLAELITEAVVVIVAFLLALYGGVLAYVVQNLKDELFDYLVRFYELGGQAGLNDLDIDAEFVLRNPAIRTWIQEWIDDVLTDGGEYDLLETTAEDLAGKIKEYQGLGLTWAMMVPLLIAYGISRAGIRSLAISSNEGIRMSRAGLVEVWSRNRVALAEYLTAQDEHVCEICAPYDGQIMTMGEAQGLIPQHGGCRCSFTPILGGWVRPEEVWTGE